MRVFDLIQAILKNTELVRIERELDDLSLCVKSQAEELSMLKSKLDELEDSMFILSADE